MRSALIASASVKGHYDNIENRAIQWSPPLLKLTAGKAQSLSHPLGTQKDRGDYWMLSTCHPRTCHEALNLYRAGSCRHAKINKNDFVAHVGLVLT